jgi:hypothetical protein
MITDHIVLGGREEAEDAGLLLDMGVTHVLNTAQQLPCYFPQQFVYLKIGLIGKLLAVFASGCDFPHVLHCAQQTSQTPRTRAWWTSRTAW